LQDSDHQHEATDTPDVPQILLHDAVVDDV
jgi:hypothetical protein